MTPDYGDPRLPERFWTKVFPEPNTGCWLWGGALTTAGYGSVRGMDQSVRYTHRLFYAALIGEIPSGLQIDHLCRNRACCNPGHLEPVTSAVNNLRSGSPSARAVRTNRCFRGHEFTPENTYHGANGRDCKRCCRLREHAKRSLVAVSR